MSKKKEKDGFTNSIYYHRCALNKQNGQLDDHYRDGISSHGAGVLRDSVIRYSDLIREAESRGLTHFVYHEFAAKIAREKASGRCRCAGRTKARNRCNRLAYSSRAKYCRQHSKKYSRRKHTSLAHAKALL